MIARFFHDLKVREVDYLLISGQATVLYGAATFSEDLDLWVRPSTPNVKAFLGVLSELGAKYYKLTPPFEFNYLEAGHGFHFVFPGEPGEDVFLDVMAKPPRVADFEKAAKSAVWLEADWGLIHTIGIRDLVELKKTQRVEDYPIISNLALQYFTSFGPGTSVKPAERNELDKVVSLADEESWKWAIHNIFTLASLRTFFEQHPRSIDALTQAIPEAVIEFGRRVLLGGDVDAGS